MERLVHRLDAAEVADTAKQAGAQVAVAGSAIYSAPDVGAAAAELRAAIV